MCGRLGVALVVGGFFEVMFLFWRWLCGGVRVGFGCRCVWCVLVCACVCEGGLGVWCVGCGARGTAVVCV